MDISQITDIEKLKALAYDQMMIIQTSQANLSLINERLQQLSETTRQSHPEAKKSQK